MKQRIDGNGNIQIHKLIINGLKEWFNSGKPAPSPETRQNYERISDAQAQAIRQIILAVELLDESLSRPSQSALLFWRANQACGVQTYRDIPAEKFTVALESIEHHLRTRKVTKANQ